MMAVIIPFCQHCFCGGNWASRWWIHHVIVWFSYQKDNTRCTFCAGLTELDPVTLFYYVFLEEMCPSKGE